MKRSKNAAPGSPYAVGYKKPPKAGQFKPGQSGNPKGRPKQSLNGKTIFHNLLSEQINMTKGGVTQKVSVLEAILRRLCQGALKGEPTSVRYLIPLAIAASDEPPADFEHDAEIIARALLREPKGKKR